MILDVENSGGLSIYLWVCLKIRNPRNPEMIHVWKPLDFWVFNFGMSSHLSSQKTKKHWRTEIPTTGRMGTDFEAALQQGNKVCSNVSTQVVLISIPPKLPTGRPFSSAGSPMLFSGFIL